MIERCSGDQAAMRSCDLRAYGQHGFTMVEMITVLILVGIMAAVALPRFFDRGGFDSHSFSDEVRATLRLAQKLAIAQHRNVCVNIITAAPASVAIKVSSTSAGLCDTPLPSQSGGGNYQITAPGSAQLTSTASTITFNALGSPGSTAITLQVDAESPITVERETGYVY